MDADADPLTRLNLDSIGIQIQYIKIKLLCTVGGSVGGSDNYMRIHGTWYGSGL
jgi:hypothetical protein